jgi:glycerol uptake facilitator-like aquaporin
MQPINATQPLWSGRLDPQLPLLRHGAGEFVGTLLLVLVLVATKLSASQPASGGYDVRLLTGAVAAGAAASALLLALGTVGGGNFNPLIAILQSIFRLHDSSRTAVLLVAQLAGGVCGATLAAFMFGVTNLFGPTQIPGLAVILAELISSAGLMIVYFGCLNSGRKKFTPLAVGAWLTASAIGLPTALANPAAALGTKLAFGDHSLQWQSVLLAILIQCSGALLAAAILSFLFPRHGVKSGPATILRNVERERAGL